MFGLTFLQYYQWRNAEWILNNPIERTEFIRFHKSIEANFDAEFQRGARNYLSKEKHRHILLNGSPLCSTTSLPPDCLI
jgi:hypothetical protein